eukprot:1523672-Pyramimonas_sp.AAC.1
MSVMSEWWWNVAIVRNMYPMHYVSDSLAFCIEKQGDHLGQERLSVHIGSWLAQAAGASPASGLDGDLATDVHYAVVDALVAQAAAQTLVGPGHKALACPWLRATAACHLRPLVHISSLHACAFQQVGRQFSAYETRASNCVLRILVIRA